MDAKVFFFKQTNKRYTLKKIKQAFLEILLKRKDRDSICLRKLLTKGFID